MIGSELPKGWKEVKLSDLAEIQSGGTPSRSNSAYWNGDIPWVKISDIKGMYVTETEEFITEEGLMNSSANFVNACNDLFIISVLTQYDNLKCPGHPNELPGTINKLYFLAASANFLSSSINDFGNK